MADWKEVNRILKDPTAVRSLASRLLKTPDYEWSERAGGFLDDMKGLPDGHVLTTRQGEFLADLRDEVEQVSKYRGFRIGILIERCFLNRLDLTNDDDIEFIERVKQLGKTSIRKAWLGRLLKCCRELGEIESYM